MFSGRLLIIFLLLALHISAQTKVDEAPVTLLRGPYLQAASKNSITIRWRTDV